MTGPHTPPPSRAGLTSRRALYDVRRLRAIPATALLALGLGIMATVRLTAAAPEPTNALVTALTMFICGFGFAIAVVVNRNLKHLGLNRYRTPWAAADREQFMAALMAVRIQQHLSDATPLRGTLHPTLHVVQVQATTDAVNAAVADVSAFQLQLLPDNVARQMTADVYAWLGTNHDRLTPEAPTP